MQANKFSWLLARAVAGSCRDSNPISPEWYVGVKALGTHPPPQLLEDVLQSG